MYDAILEISSCHTSYDTIHRLEQLFNQILQQTMYINNTVPHMHNLTGKAEFQVLVFNSFKKLLGLI